MTSDHLDSQPAILHSLSSIFQWLPTCALIIDTSGFIHEVNKQAIRFFRAATKEDFIFDKQNIIHLAIDSQRAPELIELIRKSPEPVNREVLLRRFDKTISSVDLTACLLPDNPNFMLVQFSESQPKNQAILTELSQIFRRETQRLKPYLNKPGKVLLDEIIVSNVLESVIPNKPTRIDQLKVAGEERINQLTKMFPSFSNNELIFCGFLSQRMSIEEISALTGKTPNCLRVSFHRILGKTNFSSGKELLRKIESIQ